MQKTALIIGGSGFVGGYLAEELKADYCVHVTCYGEAKQDGDIETHCLNILEKDEVLRIIDAVKPDCIFHLAAQSSVSYSWENPQLTVDVNIKGTLNLLEAVRKTGLNPRILLIGSGEEYGYISENSCPISENEPLRPANIYAVTKACQEMIGGIYCKTYGMDIITVRAFNHIGPKQSERFVASDFCRQTAEIELGMRDSISVGNLSARRDFSDVRDVVKAYGMLMETGKSGQCYNVGSGKAISISELLKLITDKSTAKISIVPDIKRQRPSDIPLIKADISRIVRDTGWSPYIKTEKTVEDMLNYWRGVLKCQD